MNVTLSCVKKVFSLINVYVSKWFSSFFFFFSPPSHPPEGGKSNEGGTNISYDS